jgi:hypothetical protein
MPPPGTPAASLILEDLSEHFPHIPPECGAALVQSAVLCLEGEGHKSGARLIVRGSFDTAFRLLWSLDVTEAMRRYWNDPEETAEQGAYALALLMLPSLVRLTVLERSRKELALTGGSLRRTIFFKQPPGSKSPASCGEARAASIGG